MAKTYWKSDPDYQRVLEILYDYWLTEPDELKVRIQMDFVKANGEKQSKFIDWENPNYKSPHDNLEWECEPVDKVKRLSDVQEDSDFWSDPFWSTEGYERKESKDERSDKR